MVSIVLVTYNRAERLKLSIRDILNQTFKDFELIICDDCSPDSTETICREFAANDKRIRYYRHSVNLRMPANGNFGIRKSIYPFVAILHDGDRFKPTLIEQWYQAISTHQSVGFVFNSIATTDADENLVTTYSEFEEGVIPKDYLLKKVFFRRWQFYSPVYGEAMVKKELVVEGGYLKNRYGFYADVDLWMRLLHTHDAYYCADTLITGPTKSIQPRLFNDNLIQTFLYMLQMQIFHRKRAFKDRPLTLVKEVTICWVQAFFYLNFLLLLLIKNSPFKSFINAAKLLKRSILFIIPWIGMLIFYPLLYPFLKLFNAIKILFLKPTSKDGWVEKLRSIQLFMCLRHLQSMLENECPELVLDCGLCHVL